MTTARRIYQYAVAFVSLIMLAIGASGLGHVVVEAVTAPGAGAGTGLRAEVTQNGALALVGLPVWLLHWLLAARAGRRDPRERAATLRRLYVYGVMAVMAVRAAFSAHRLVATAGTLALGGDVPRAAATLLDPLPWLIVALALWAHHRRVAIEDRRQAGEAGGSATLRRWYSYGVAFGGLALWLNGGRSLLQQTWEILVDAIAAGPAVLPVTGAARNLAGAIASLLVGLALWLVHWRLYAVGASARPGEGARGSAPGAADASMPAQRPAGERSAVPPGASGAADASVLAQDTRSVLRPVYLFLALGVAVAVTLDAAAMILYLVLRQALGVPAVSGPLGLARALGAPASALAVFGASWLYHRQALAAQARAQAELPRQAGVRRLYTYLVALIALSLAATGAGGLLWTLADLLTDAQRNLGATGATTWFRTQTSLFATLLAVGLPVWLRYWRPRAGARAAAGTGGETALTGDTGSLARRLYLYLTLLAGVLALLGAGAAAAKQVLDLALGEAATPSVVTNLARALSVAAVAGLTVYYHQRVLRRDVEEQGRQAAAQAAAPPVPPQALPAGGGAGQAVVADGVRPYGVVARRGPSETSAWFATLEEARREYQRLRQEAAAADWVALTRVEEASGPLPVSGTD